MDLVSLHDRVDAALERARTDRDAPVFLIEHGLCEGEVAALFEALREEAVLREGGAARLREPSGHWWNSRYLALLVAMTEVGYAYGDRREYWPTLEARLGGLHLDDETRRAMVRRFNSSRQEPPPATPWANNFTHIAWPVSHAVLPRWLQAELLQLVVQCPHRIEPGGAYLQWMLKHGRSARRLALVLHPDRERQARAIIEALADDDAHVDDVLGSAFVTRLRDDVRSAPETRRLRDKVRRSLLHVPKARPSASDRRTPRPTAGPDPLVAALTLTMRPPRLGVGALRRALLHDAQAERRRVLVLEERRVVSLGQLNRTGAPLERLPALAEGAERRVPLVSPSSASSLPGQLGRVVGALRVDLTDPILFSDRGGRDVAVQSSARACGVGCGWWLLTQRALPRAPGLRDVTSLCGWTLAAVDASDAGTAAWLRGCGVDVVQDAVVDVIGPPPLDGPGGTWFEVDDAVFLTARGAAVVVREDQGWRPFGGALLRSPTAGSAVVEVSAVGSERAAATFTVERRARSGPAPSRDGVSLRPDFATVAHLRARAIRLEVAEAVAIAGTPVTIGLREGAAWRYARTNLVDGGVVTADDEVWSRLGDVPPDGGAMALSVEVGGLAFARWTLEPEPEPEERDDELGDLADAGEGVHELWSSAEAPDELQGERPAGVALRVRSWRGGHYCELLAPDRLVLGDGPRLVVVGRRERTRVEELLRAAHRWRAATVSDMVSAWWRSSVTLALEDAVVGVVCGEAWRDQEALWRERPATIADDLARALLVPGVGWVDDGVALDVPGALHRLFARELRRRGVDGAGSRVEREAWCSQHLDPVSKLFERFLERVRLGGLDPRLELDEVRERFERVAMTRRRSLGEALGWLLLPRSLGEEVLSLAASPGTIDAAASLLAHRLRARGNAWSQEAVAALLTLWASDDDVADQHLVAAASAATSDQQGARAVRVVALGIRERSA